MSNEEVLDEHEPRGTQILWGRVLVLLLALALAFWLGTTFGGDTTSQRQIGEQRAEIARLEAQITSLEAELAAVDAGGDQTAQAPADEPSEVAAAQTSQKAAPSEGDRRGRRSSRDRGREYVIQSGDSLAAIAQDVYGDPTKWRDIARANDLTEPYSLTVGESLRIPAVP